jgi:glycosyltransferase 2 family protein
MLSRERLSRLAELASRAANERRVRVAGQVLLAAGLVFVALRLRSIWNDSHISLGSVRWAFVTAALMVAALAVALASLTWTRILLLLDVHVPPRFSGIYLESQLAKYVPGSLWQYAGRIALARDVGIPVRATGASVTLELAGAMTAAAVCSLLTLGLFGLLPAAALCLGGLALSPTRLARMRAGARAFAFAFYVYVGITLLLGCSLWLLSRGLFAEAAGGYLLYAGAFSVAWLVGLVAVFAPGGIGVREAVLVALLRGRLSTADAVVLAAASRLVLTVVDLAAAGIGAAIWRRRPRPVPLSSAAAGADLGHGAPRK